MKKLIVITLLLVLPVLAYAQERKGFTAHGQFHTGVTVGKYDQGYTFVGGQLSAGYAFNKRLSLSFVCDFLADLIHTQSVDSNYLNLAPGLQLAVDVTEPKGRVGCELFGSLGSTLPITGFEYLYGEVGIRTIKRYSAGWSPFFSVGIRYQNVYNKAFDNFVMANIGVGFMFN